MNGRHCFVNVGLLDREAAARWVDDARHNTEEPSVELIDDRVWFARACDVDTVRAEIEALRLAMTSLTDRRDRDVQT